LDDEDGLRDIVNIDCVHALIMLGIHTGIISINLFQSIYVL